MSINLNCYNMYPKEERKLIQDFIDDADFTAAELRNLLKLKRGQMEDRDPDDVADMERDHLDLLESIIDQAEELAHDLREYKADV